MNRSVVFVTCRNRAALTPDDMLAAAALREATGIEVLALPWDTPDAPWEEFSLVVLRSTWDYFHRPVEFSHWLNDLKRRKVKVLNPPELALWNAEKTYLRELASRFPIVPTIWVDRGKRENLASVLRREGWQAAVVKPTVSGTAFETWTTSPEQAADPAEQSRFEGLLQIGGMMIQPYLEEIVTRGEWSIVFFDGKYSHAILKKPAPGDFRVQMDFGGTWRALAPPDALIEHARQILIRAGEVTGQATPLYARVDGVESRQDNQFLLMELELIEPVLFFAANPAHSPHQFARALLNRLPK